MSSTVRPDNLRVALDAKFAAALSRLVELRETEQPHGTPHLSAREIVAAFLDYVHGVYRIADVFGKAQAGDLQFNAWYQEWWGKLNKADRLLWRHVRDDRVQQAHLHSADLIEVEVSAAARSAPASPSLPGRQADVRKRLVRFAAYPNRSAGDVCEDCLRLARRFAQDFVNDYARFLPDP